MAADRTKESRGGRTDRHRCEEVHAGRLTQARRTVPLGGRDGDDFCETNPIQPRHRGPAAQRLDVNAVVEAIDRPFPDAQLHRMDANGPQRTLSP